MLGLVVGIVYAIIIPYEIVTRSYLEICIYLFLGHWLLLNTLFNYSMAFRTKPGTPPPVIPAMKCSLSYMAFTGGNDRRGGGNVQALYRAETTAGSSL